MLLAGILLRLSCLVAAPGGGKTRQDRLLTANFSRLDRRCFTWIFVGMRRICIAQEPAHPLTTANASGAHSEANTARKVVNSAG